MITKPYNFSLSRPNYTYATDDHMAMIFGDDWINTPYGEITKKLNNLLEPFGWYFDLADQMMYRIDDSFDMIGSSIRHATMFYLIKIGNK